MPQASIVEKIKTHILCSFTPFFFENRAVCEIMWKNIVESDRPQMTIWRMPFECWVTEATDLHSECVILNCFSTATMVTRTLLNVTVYVQCLSCCNRDGECAVRGAVQGVIVCL
jgi:hypothetical protein